MKEVRGEITVFFSLVVVLLLSFFCSLVEAARVKGARLQIEAAVDVSCESLFAAYDVELYKNYNVFFFEGYEGTEFFQKECISEKMEMYLHENVHPQSSYFFRNSDFYQLNVEENQLLQLALASDDNGMVFREEAVRSMKMQYGITLIEQLLGQSEQIKTQLQKGAEYESEQEKNELSLKELEEEKNKADKQMPIEAQEANQNENPALIIKEQKAAGILDLVMEEMQVLSQNGVSPILLPSGRQLNEGDGYAQYDTSEIAQVLFNEYLMQQFICAQDKEHEDGILWYELEYLLEGKAHDVDNLKAVVRKLLLAREGANFAYLLTDTGKMAQAEALAVTLVGYTGIVPLVKGTKYALLLAWAYVESLLDVKRLLAGKKVALIKNLENWQMELSNITDVMSSELKDDLNGMTYKDYIRVLLFLEKEEVLAKRCLDLVEVNMRKKEEGMDFRIDKMVSAFEVQLNISSSSVFYNPLFFYKEKGWNGALIYKVHRSFQYGSWN